MQALIAKLFTLPTLPSPDGPLAQLPPPILQLPRAKPLPKPKPPTKWDRFAAAKGIQKKRRERKVWDEEKQEWINRWEKGAQNKKEEDVWLSEVPANAGVSFSNFCCPFESPCNKQSGITDVGHDPVKVARDARKARVAKNENQRLQNLSRAQSGGRNARMTEIERSLATTRISTASMGKFDKPLDGERKLRGVKRKVHYCLLVIAKMCSSVLQFDPIEASLDQEKKASLMLLSRMDGDAKKMKRDPPEDNNAGVLNVRKALRFASNGRGGAALGRELTRSKERKVRKGKRS